MRIYEILSNTRISAFVEMTTNKTTEPFGRIFLVSVVRIFIVTFDISNAQIYRLTARLFERTPVLDSTLPEDCLNLPLNRLKHECLVESFLLEEASY